MLGIFNDSGGQDGREGEVVADEVRLRGRGQITCIVDLEFYKNIRLNEILK